MDKNEKKVSRNQFENTLHVGAKTSLALILDFSSDGTLLRVHPFKPKYDIEPKSYDALISQIKSKHLNIT